MSVGVVMANPQENVGSSSTFRQEIQNFKFEPGLLSHYEDLIARLGGQNGFYSTVCDCDLSLKYLDIGCWVSISLLFWVL